MVCLLTKEDMMCMPTCSIHSSGLGWQRSSTYIWVCLSVTGHSSGRDMSSGMRIQPKGRRTLV